MNFEVETGTGSATATSYATVQQFKDYWTDRGTNYTAETDVNIQAWLNSATEYIDFSYIFEGKPNTELQALEWPRSGATKRGCYGIEATEIPVSLINSVSYMAAQAKAGRINPIDNGIKQQSYGPVSKTYSKSSTSKSYPAVDKLLKYLVISGNELRRVN